MSSSTLPKLSTSQVIKLFTNVPTKFVDDFFSLYDPKDPSTFIVDLDTLTKWLGVKKTNLMDTLRKSYKKGEDYIEEKKPKLDMQYSNGGNRNIQVTLTADCMKRLCMRSRSDKAETVRTYFIEIEEFIFHYNDEIVNGLMKSIKTLQEKNITKKKPDGPGFVYIIRAAEGFNKFGHTQDLTKRLATYNTGRIEDVEVLHVYSTEYRKELERCVKKLMAEKQFKNQKEIYEVDVEIIKKVIKGCARLSMKLHYKGKPSKMDGKYYLIFSSDIPSS